MYIRQNPNAKVVQPDKPSCMSTTGPDRTLRWINRTLRKLGDAPVIYTKRKPTGPGKKLLRLCRIWAIWVLWVEPIFKNQEEKDEVGL